jgi:hypothetical protein
LRAILPRESSRQQPIVLDDVPSARHAESCSLLQPWARVIQAMTEDDWLHETDPIRMLTYLGGSASERKLRLFACAACRRIWRVIREERCRRVVEVSELFADGRVDKKQLQAAAGDAASAVALAEQKRAAGWNAARTAAETAGSAQDAAIRAAGSAAFDADLVRDIFGNPFRTPSLDASCRAWNDGILGRLALALYDERHLPRGTLDPLRLAVLADALEEAGCSDPTLLAHCREPGLHVLGCWALDLILGRS